MLAAPAIGRPRPIPTLPTRPATPSWPSSWLTDELVSVGSAPGASGRSYHAAPNAKLDPAYRPGASPISAVPATTLAEAVAFAQRSATPFPPSMGTPRTQAVAVLQAESGAWYLASLADQAGAYADIGSASDVTAVTRLHPDVRAVVGATAWVNFTDAPIGA